MAQMRMTAVGVGALLFAGSMAWAVFSPAAYSCPGYSSQIGLRTVGPNEPDIGTPGEVLPVCNTRGPGLNHPVWGSKDDRVPQRASVALAGATVCAGLIVVTRRRKGDRHAYQSSEGRYG